MPENVLTMVQNADDGYAERFYSIVNGMAFNVATAVACSDVTAILPLGWCFGQLGTGGFQYVDVAYGLGCTPLSKGIVKYFIKITLRCRAEAI